MCNQTDGRYKANQGYLKNLPLNMVTLEHNWIKMKNKIPATVRACLHLRCSCSTIVLSEDVNYTNRKASPIGTGLHRQLG